MRSLLLASCVLVLGCSSDNDKDFTDLYPMSEINGSYGAFADEGNFRVLAAYIRSGFLRLRSGDTVEVTVNGAPVAAKERLDDEVHYVVDMAPPPEEMTVAITFVRGLERSVGTVRVAQAFDFVAPPATVAIGDKVDVDINPRPDLSKWPGFFGPGLKATAEITADCLESGSQQIDLCADGSTDKDCKQAYPTKLDTSKLTFRPGTTLCDLTVQVRLNSGGQAYEAQGPQKQNLKGGGFDAYRAKSFKLTARRL